MFEKKPTEAIINLLVFGYCQIKDLLIKLGSMGTTQADRRCINS